MAEANAMKLLKDEGPAKMDTHSTQPLRTETSAPAPAVEATLEHIFISPGHDYWTRRPAGEPAYGIADVPSVRCVAGRGLEGDRYYGGKKDKPGQVTFLAAEAIDAIRAHFHLPDLSPAVFRRNLIVRGMNLPALMGRRFTFKGIAFEGAQECKPCIWMDRAVAPGAQAFMREPFRGGLRARILTDGELRVDRRP